MIIPVETGQRKSSDIAAAVGGPEKGFLIVSAVGHVAASRDTVRQARALAHGGAVPDGRAQETRALADRGAPEDAVGRVEPGGVALEEDSPLAVVAPASPRKRTSASQRFERRAEKIARAAEVGVGPLVEQEADFLPPLVEKRLPEVPDEGPLPRRYPGEQPRRENANPGVQKRPLAADPESRDAVPFGLKRRVPLGVPVFRYEERGGAPGLAVAGNEGSEVGRDGSVGVHDEKITAGEKGRRVAQGAGRAEDRRLAEKRELWKARSLLAQTALDLIAQVMQIHSHLCDAGLLKPLEVRESEGNVEKR